MGFSKTLIKSNCNIRNYWGKIFSSPNKMYLSYSLSVWFLKKKSRKMFIKKINTCNIKFIPNKYIKIFFFSLDNSYAQNCN